jgi:hypothetical protein
MSGFEVHKHCPRDTSSKNKFSGSLQSGTHCHRHLILSGEAYPCIVTLLDGEKGLLYTLSLIIKRQLVL